ncbi:MAG: hydrogenase expression/formation protein HypE [Candidatus Cloacimonetes bacterium]|nr:hydrogenase expression/formation protein HypE [Candidatus Cloacimonadota bacterium]
MKDKHIIMSHGSGAALTRQLIKEVFAGEFRISTLDDAVCIDGSLTVTTDAYVVNPIFFPGGDIGKLSITGTVNDLCMNGSRPAYILASFILEEGFAIDQLHSIVSSMQSTAEEAGVQIIAGDTKVVEKGRCDGLYITTAGIGFLPGGIHLDAGKIRSGDKIIVNGTLGDHAIAIINARQQLGLTPAPESDCAPLHEVIRILLQNTNLKFARDATRGGVATILNEICDDTGLGIIIDESSLPVKYSTRVLCDMLGLDPLYLANEGKLIAFIGEANDDLLSLLKTYKYSYEAAVIGQCTNEVKGVFLRTILGRLRPLLMLASDPLPRIC